MTVGLKKGPHSVERRKHKRFRIMGDAYAFNDNDFGQIIDIGMGGLAIFTSSEEEWQKETNELNLVFTDDELILEEIQARNIANAVPSYKKPLPGPAANRCSMQFVGLTPFQQIRLQHIINNNTAGEV